MLIATLDVRNAFNSVRWADMLKALEKRFNTPYYLMRIIRSYLQDRILLYEINEGLCEKKISSSASQRSILGPDLWHTS